MKDLNCSYCSKEFTFHRKKKYCSDQCLKNATNERSRQYPLTTACTECDNMFESIHPRNVFCSITCKDKNRNRRRKDYRQEFYKEYRDKNFQYKPIKQKCVPTLRSRIYYTVVNDQLSVTSKKQKQSTYDIERLIHQAKVYVKMNCNECNKRFINHPSRRFCSSKCSLRNSCRIRRHKERARLRAVTVETVDPVKVFNHYKWKCCNCKCNTPRKLRGTLKPNAPELDHIVPLSKGGEHSYRNVQLLCKRCNSSKLDNVLMIGYSTKVIRNINKGRGGR